MRRKEWDALGNPPGSFDAVLDMAEGNARANYVPPDPMPDSTAPVSMTPRTERDPQFGPLLRWHDKACGMRAYITEQPECTCGLTAAIEREAAGTGLDVERLALALTRSLPGGPWMTRKSARAIATEYARLATPDTDPT